MEVQPLSSRYHKSSGIGGFTNPVSLQIGDIGGFTTPVTTVPEDVLKLFEESGLKIMTKLINTIYETGEWPNDFTVVTMIGLKKKTQATKCINHRTISLITHTTKIVAKILRRRIERKLRMYSNSISLDLEEEKELGMQLGC